MKNIVLLLISLPFLAQAESFFEAEYGEQPNHLTPLDYPPGAYDQKVIDKLLITSGELGRFITRPSFEAETCVSVYKNPDTTRITHSNESKYFITTTKASESIWYSMPQNNHTRTDSPIEVTRTDREISQHLAISIQRVWGRMLQHTKYPAKVSLGLDGTTYQFSVWVKGIGNLHGETWTPDKGLPAEMVAIGKELAQFTENKATNEEQLIKRLKEFESKIPKA